MDKENVVYIYIYNGVLLDSQKNEILPIYNNVDGLEGIMLNEISQRKTNII